MKIVQIGSCSVSKFDENPLFFSNDFGDSYLPYYITPFQYFKTQTNQIEVEPESSLKSNIEIGEQKRFFGKPLFKFSDSTENEDDSRILLTMLIRINKDSDLLNAIKNTSIPAAQQILFAIPSECGLALCFVIDKKEFESNKKVIGFTWTGDNYVMFEIELRNMQYSFVFRQSLTIPKAFGQYKIGQISKLWFDEQWRDSLSNFHDQNMRKQIDKEADNKAKFFRGTKKI